MLIDRIPLREPICEECLAAFRRNVVEPEPEEEPHHIH
jgi:hypothetical protein